jgi:hypothetical protein
MTALTDLIQTCWRLRWGSKISGRFGGWHDDGAICSLAAARAVRGTASRHVASPTASDSISALAAWRALRPHRTAHRPKAGRLPEHRPAADCLCRLPRC